MRRILGSILLLALCGCQALLPARPTAPQNVESSATQGASLSIRISLPRETQALPSNTQSIRVLLRKSGQADRTATVDTGSPTTVTFSALPPGGGYTLYAASYSGLNATGTMLSWGALALTLASGLNSATFGLSVAVRSGTGADDLVAGPAGNQAQQLGAQKTFTSMTEFDPGVASGVEVFYPNQYSYLGQFGGYGWGNGQLNGPDGVGVDARGDVYVADRVNNRIQKFDRNLAFLRGWGEGVIWTAAQTPPATASGTANGWFSEPLGSIAVDGAGNIWVSDVYNHRVQKFDPNGTFLMGVGNGTVWYAGTSAPAPAAGSANGQFNLTHGCALDLDGNVWVSDPNNHRVQKFSPGGQFLMAIGNGTSWQAGAAPPTPVASDSALYFNYPTGLGVDAAGNLYVADTQNRRIQKISATATLITQWALTANAYPLAVMPTGRILAGTSSDPNNRIGVHTPAGTLLSQFGSPGSGNGQFVNMRPLACMQDGTVLAVDYGNNRVQRFRGVNMLDNQGGLRLTGHRQPDTPVFANSGTYDTPPVDAGTSTTWGSIFWNVSLQPANTGVATSVATSSNGLSWGAWVPVAGSSAVGNNSANLTGITGRHLKVRLTLLTTDISVSPEVQDVGVTY